LPIQVSKEDLIGWQVQLELNETQINSIHTQHAFLTWHELNDIVKFTFPQFIKLLDLINN
jgi:hypothetical protein